MRERRRPRRPCPCRPRRRPSCPSLGPAWPACGSRSPPGRPGPCERPRLPTCLQTRRRGRTPLRGPSVSSPAGSPKRAGPCACARIARTVRLDSKVDLVFGRVRRRVAHERDVWAVAPRLPHAAFRGSDGQCSGRAWHSDARNRTFVQQRGAGCFLVCGPPDAAQRWPPHPSFARTRRAADLRSAARPSPCCVSVPVRASRPAIAATTRRPGREIERKRVPGRKAKTTTEAEEEDACACACACA